MNNPNAGWIKLHRKLRENIFYSNTTAVAIWVECLLRATHEGQTFILNRQKLQLEPGQFAMGYKEFGDTFKVSKSTVHFWLSAFELERMIERKSDTQGTVVTILNWITYQEDERKPEHQENAKRTQKYLNKNVKNVKNDKNSLREGDLVDEDSDKKYSQKKSITPEVLDELASKFNVPIAFVENSWDTASNWLTAKGKVQKDYKAFFTNWLKRDMADYLLKYKNFSNQNQYVKAGIAVIRN